MKQLITYTVLIFSTAIFITCKNGSSPVLPVVISKWTQCQGLPNNLPVTDFAASGNNLVAGAYNKGASQAYIYFSVDDGSSWALDTTFHVYNKLPYNHLYLSTPVTFLSYGGYLFAGIGGGYRGDIYRSTDNGVTWSDNGISWPPNDTITFAEDINCFAAVCGNIYAGTDHGVFLSTDQGISWSGTNSGFPLLAPFGLPPQVLRMIAKGMDLFVGGASGNGIFLSTNSGSSWTAANTGLTRTYVSSFAVSGTNLFAGTIGGVFLSTNNGTSWTNTGLTNTDVFSLAVSGTNLFAGTYLDGIFLSTNNGASWTQVNTGLTSTYVPSFAVSGTNLFAGTNSGLFLSTNEGEMWNNISAGTPIDSMAIGTIAVINSQLFVAGPWYGAWHRRF